MWGQKFQLEENIRLGHMACDSHTGLTYHFKFLTFGHSGAQHWVPKCPNVRNLKCRLHLYGTEHLKHNHMMTLSLEKRKKINLGFHQPEKDQCDFCRKCEHLDDNGRAEIKSKMEEHEHNKTATRELKAVLKEHAKSGNKISVAY